MPPARGVRELSEDHEKHDLGREQHAEGGQEAPPARESRHPERDKESRLVNGKNGKRALGVSGRSQLRQGARGHGTEGPRGGEDRRGESGARDDDDEGGRTQCRAGSSRGPSPPPVCRRLPPKGKQQDADHGQHELMEAVDEEQWRCREGGRKSQKEQAREGESGEEWRRGRQGQGAPGPTEASREDARDIERDESGGQTFGGHHESPAARRQHVAVSGGTQPRGGEDEGGRTGHPGAGREQGFAPRDPRTAECESDEEHRRPRHEAAHPRGESAFFGVTLRRRPRRAQGHPHPEMDVAGGGDHKDRGPDLEMESTEERRLGGGAAEGRDAHGVEAEYEGDGSGGPREASAPGDRTGEDGGEAQRENVGAAALEGDGDRRSRGAGVVIGSLRLQLRDRKDEPLFHPRGAEESEQPEAPSERGQHERRRSTGLRGHRRVTAF